MDLAEHLAAGLAGRSLRFVTGFRHRLEPNFRCSLHHHAALEVIYHPTGQGEAGLADGSRLPITPGCALVHAERAPHDQHLVTAGEDWCIQVTSSSWPAEMHGRSWLIPQVDDPALIADLTVLSKRFTRGPSHDHRATALVLGLLAASRAGLTIDAAVPPSAAAALAERAAALIRERFAGLEGIAELARLLEVSPDYLRHSFAHYHGCSPVAYLTARRINRAKDLLRYTFLPLAEIAGQCGYASPRYFSSAFRRAVGCAPSAYRTRRSDEVEVL